MHWYPRVREMCTGLADLILQQRSVCYSEVFITVAAQHQRRGSYLPTAPLKMQPPKEATI